MTNPVSDLFTTLSDDAKASLLGIVQQAHDNIKANPTTQTIAAQWALLALTAPTLIPTLQTEAINAGNDAILAAAMKVLSPSTPATGSAVGQQSAVNQGAAS